MTRQATPRFIALDIFKGMAACFMITVNTPGDFGKVFAPLNRTGWNGCTSTDRRLGADKLEILMRSEDGSIGQG